MSVQIPLMSEAALLRNLGIPASGGSPASYVQADSNRSMSSTLAGPIPTAFVGHKSSASFPNSKKADPLSSSH